MRSRLGLPYESARFCVKPNPASGRVGWRQQQRPDLLVEVAQRSVVREQRLFDVGHCDLKSVHSSAVHHGKGLFGHREPLRSWQLFNLRLTPPLLVQTGPGLSALDSTQSFFATMPNRAEPNSTEREWVVSGSLFCASALWSRRQRSPLDDAPSLSSLFLISFSPKANCRCLNPPADESPPQGFREEHVLYQRC